MGIQQPAITLPFTLPTCLTPPLTHVPKYLPDTLTASWVLVALDQASTTNWMPLRVITTPQYVPRGIVGQTSTRWHHSAICTNACASTAPAIHVTTTTYSTIQPPQQDQWFMAQILNSPLRVADPACADVVFVPVVFSNNRTTYYQQLMENPHTHLPLLGTLPHFMVLGQPRDVHAMRNDPLVCVLRGSGGDVSCLHGFLNWS